MIVRREREDVGVAVGVEVGHDMTAVWRGAAEDHGIAVAQHHGQRARAGHALREIELAVAVEIGRREAGPDEATRYRARSAPAGSASRPNE